MARKVKTIAAWINANTGGRLLASVRPTVVSTDRPKPRGLRYRTHTGKGRAGFILRVILRSDASLVFEHNTAERYRDNTEVEKWLAKWLAENPS